jgi:hypothetical protein
VAVQAKDAAIHQHYRIGTVVRHGGKGRLERTRIARLDP